MHDRPASCVRSAAGQRGIAIALILTAVAVVAALSIVLTLSARSGAETSETNSNSLLATSLINQAVILKSALVVTQARDGYVSPKQHLNTQQWNHDSNGTGIFNALDGGADPQTPPPNSVTSSSTGWRWGGDNWSYALQIAGLAGYQFVLSLSYIEPAVCAQIDKQLTGSATIPAVTQPLDLQTLSGWDNLSSNAAYNALSGYHNICFVDSNNEYQYYQTVVDDSV